MSRSLGKWLMASGIALILFGTVLGVIGYLQIYHGSVEVTLRKFGVQVEVYRNQFFYVTENFSFGPNEPGSTSERLIRVQNTRNALINLTLQTDLAFQKYHNLSWNYSGQALAPNQTIPIMLTLTISPDLPNNVVNYSFTATIIARNIYFYGVTPALYSVITPLKVVGVLQLILEEEIEEILPKDVLFWANKPNMTTTQLICVQNLGDASVTLTLQTDISSEYQKYYNFSWNYSGQTLAPSQIIPITLTLKISPDMHGISYDFTVTITAINQAA